jgi:spermidine synthase
LRHPLEHLDVVEISRGVLRADAFFAPHNYGALDDSRLRVYEDDGASFLRTTPRRYDVIISEPSNPWMTIAANLFTEEFFRMARTRVRPGGIYCQWIQNYYLPAEDLRSIAAAFHASFPHILLFETIDGVDLLLLGSDTPLSLNLEQIDYRISDMWVRADLSRVGLRDSADILSTFRLGDREVSRMVAGAARNTDDNARVEFSAPKSLGSETITDNLVLLRRFNGDPLDYIDPPVTDRAARDELRISIAEALLRRGNYDLALEQARQVGEGPQEARAAKILSLLAAESSGN